MILKVLAQMVNLLLDFSSEFSSIQHTFKVKLLVYFNLDVNFMGWIVDFLTWGWESICLNGSSCTRALEFCVLWLSVMLYILYTIDGRRQQGEQPMLKFAHDTIINLLPENELEHGTLVWVCHMVELSWEVIPPTIAGLHERNWHKCVHIYLEIVLDNSLKFDANLKPQQNMYFRIVFNIAN